MKNVFGAIVITAVALATTAALAENTVSEHRARLAALWSQDNAVPDGRTIASLASAANFTGITSVLRFDAPSLWAKNFKGGRVNPPAGH